MNYEIFKEIVAEQFLSFMPPEFANHTVEIRPVKKVNQTLDGLTLLPPEGAGGKAHPTIYLNHIYEDYQKKDDVKATLKEVARQLTEIYDKGELNISSFTPENFKNRVVMMLINTEQNQELLKDIPNRPFRDLSIVYRYLVGMEEDEIQTTLVTDSLAKHMGMSEQEIYEAATLNTYRLFTPVVKTMNDVIRDMFISDGMEPGLADMMVGEIPPENGMYVITNERGIHGAVSMLYEKELQKLAGQLDSDLYIMPSSVHEVIAVSSKMGDPYELAEMVAEINMTQVQLDERLSNQVYHYDKDLRKITLATDTPNKRLDGMVAEPSLIYEEKRSR